MLCAKAPRLNKSASCPDLTTSQGTANPELSQDTTCTSVDETTTSHSPEGGERMGVGYQFRGWICKM